MHWLNSITGNKSVYGKATRLTQRVVFSAHTRAFTNTLRILYPTYSLVHLLACITHPSIHPPIHPSTYPSIHASIHPRIHLKMCGIECHMDVNLTEIKLPSIYPKDDKERPHAVNSMNLVVYVFHAIPQTWQ